MTDKENENTFDPFESLEPLDSDSTPSGSPVEPPSDSMDLGSISPSEFPSDPEPFRGIPIPEESEAFLGSPQLPEEAPVAAQPTPTTVDSSAWEAPAPVAAPVMAPVSAPAASVPSSGRASVKPRAEDVFRGMWASLFFSGRMTERCALICASARREGASTMACGMALAGSGPSGGARVALVDFNLRNPAIAKMLGLRPSPGLIEAVADGQDPTRVAQRVNESLYVIPSGNIGARSLDVLRSGAVETFFQRLRESYDYVLVDAAPVNHYPDAQVLAGVLKEVVLVANCDQTPREAVAQAKKRIESGGGRLSGVVLNLRSFPIPGFLYRRV